MTVRVVRGHPTPQQVAAVVVALDAAARDGAAESSGGRGVPPAWLRAARAEGVGAARAASPQDVRPPGW